MSKHTHYSSTPKNTDKGAAKTAAELASQIGETRAQIADQLTTLSSVGSPSPWKDEDLQTSNEAGTGIFDVEADKPLEVSDVSGLSEEIALGAKVPGPYDKSLQAKDAAIDSAIDIKGVVVDKAIEVKDTVADKAVEAKDVVVDKAIEVKDVVVDTAIEAKDVVVDKAIEVKDVVVDTAIEVKDKVVELEQIAADKAVMLKDEGAQLLAEVKVAVTEKLDDLGQRAKRLGGEAWQFTAANPVPLALIGASTVWMIANRKRSTRKPAYPRLPVELASDSLESTAVRDITPERDLFAVPSTARPRARMSAAPLDLDHSKPSLKAAASDATNGLAVQASEAARAVKHELEQGTELVRKSVEQGTDYVRKNVVRATDATMTFAKANPLALAMSTLAVGVGIGMLMPRVRKPKVVLAVSATYDRIDDVVPVRKPSPLTEEVHSL